LLADELILLTGPNGLQPGSLSYDPAAQRLTFTPSQFLLPFSQYQVTVKKELADSLGNSLAQDVSWSFTTIFDLQPPALPDF
jgi:hypothetical protein